MEKFGIFELLDALSAITAAEPAQQQPQQNDAAYRAPDDQGAPPSQAAQEKPHTDGALSSFYARHEAVARKAEQSPKS